MKIDKTLLKAIVIGASLGAVSSCSLTDVVDTEIVQEDAEACNTEGAEDGRTYNCPACGMG